MDSVQTAKQLIDSLINDGVTVSEAAPMSMPGQKKSKADIAALIQGFLAQKTGGQGAPQGGPGGPPPQGMGMPSMGQGQPGMGQPQMGMPSMGQRPQMGMPSMGQGQPGMGQPQMGMPSMGQGQPGMGMPPMGQPQNMVTKNGEDEDSMLDDQEAAYAATIQPPAAAGIGQVAHDVDGRGSIDGMGQGQELGTMQGNNDMESEDPNMNCPPGVDCSKMRKRRVMPSMTAEQVRNDILGIFGSQNLSEDFMSKASSIYEAAVMAKAKDVIEEIHEQYETAFAQEVEDQKQELTEKVDSYLNYVVEEWMTENKLAIENGIRTDIAENFIDKLKGLFLESYIEVPQNKVNLFDEMSSTITELEGRVNEELTRNVSLINENKAARAVGIFTEETKNLTDIQSDKIAKLAENLEFTSEDDFRDKMRTIVYNFGRASVLTETVINTRPTAQNIDNNKYLVETMFEDDSPAEEVVSNDPYIKMYSDILTRSVQK
jgi:hypothetical protein